MPTHTCPSCSTVFEVKAVAAGTQPDDEVDLFVAAGDLEPADEVLVEDPDGTQRPAFDEEVAEVKAGGFVPFKKGESPNRERAGDGQAKVKRGDYVEWSSSGGKARGKVDLVVVGGVVPGTKGNSPVFGSRNSPAARVVVYEKDGEGWKATDTKVGHRASSLTKIDPLPSGKAAKKGYEALVALLAETETMVSGSAAMAAFERGLAAWPGPAVTTLDRDGWALGRAGALLNAAEGKALRGFADEDLLLQ